MYFIAITACLFSFNVFSKEYLIKLNGTLTKATGDYISKLGVVSEIPVDFAHFKNLSLSIFLLSNCSLLISKLLFIFNL